jgi:hypothetical protein
MKNVKNITASVAALIVAATAFGGTIGPKELGARPNPQEIAAIVFGGHDTDNDGALNSAELATSIEALYEMRDDTIRARREALAERGVISAEELSEGFVTLSLMPDVAADLVMKNADVNENLVLEADELVAAAGSLRKFDLGTGPRFERRS